MNIAEILKKCPTGTKLYSPLFGEVEFVCVKDNTEYSIRCATSYGDTPLFMRNGIYFGAYPHAECMLFPSKDQRDWNKFVVPDQKPKYQFNPFDKVLVRDSDIERWICNFFCFIDEDGDYICVNAPWKQCIPYEGNEHLLGTTNAPE